MRYRQLRESGLRGASGPGAGGPAGRRENVVLATKFGMDMGDGTVARGSRKYIRRAVEESLRRLQTDYIDLYQYHAPDGVTPFEETLATLDDLITDGKVRYIGSSNFAGWQIADADWIARTRRQVRFVSAQNHYSLLQRDAEREVIPSCMNCDVGVLPYFPLANGLLTGKYSRGQGPPRGTRLAGRESELTDEVFDKLEALERFGEEHWTLATGCCDRWPGGHAGDRFGYRGGDETRTSADQCHRR